MKCIQLLAVITLLALAHADMTVAVVDESDLFKFSGEGDLSCSAAAFPLYLDHLLSGAAYPENCETPAVNVFEDVDVVYIEEVSSIKSVVSKDVMTVTETTTMRPIVDYYGKHAVDVSRICYSKGDANCPAGFTVVNNTQSFVFGNKTIIYRPLYNVDETATPEVVKAVGDRNMISFYPVSTRALYTEEEVVEKNIIFVTVVILLIVAAATVLVVATIDYGDDYAGLYSKYKQEKSQ
ncbi:hypothetical protein WA556_004403 [Blastocystis sp. ATCC 50177/Nand II]